MDKIKVNLKLEDAEKLLPDGDTIHTFVNPAGMLIGADWDRKVILEKMKKHGVRLSGEQATKMHHGLVIHDGNKYIFIETRKVSYDHQ